MEKYLNANLTINNTVIAEKALAARIYSIEKLKTIGEYAIKNYAYSLSEAPVASPNYAAIYTGEVAYRDTESPGDINAVAFRFKELIDIAVNILAPGKNIARSAAKNIQYNTNYYKNEISNQVNAQFGTGAWVYDDFIDELVDNFVSDSITTDVTKTSDAYTITLSAQNGTDFIVGEVVTSSGGGIATVLEWDSENDLLLEQIMLSLVLTEH